MITSPRADDIGMLPFIALIYNKAYLTSTGVDLGWISSKTDRVGRHLLGKCMLTLAKMLG